MPRTVFFEEIKAGHRLPISCYVRLGWRVLFKNVGKNYDGSAWLKRLEDTGRIERVIFAKPLYYGQEPSTDMAITAVRGVGHRVLRESLVRFIGRLYQSEDAGMAFEKILIDILGQYYYCVQMVERLAELGHTDVRFVPKDHNFNATLNAAWCYWVGSKIAAKIAGAAGTDPLMPLGTRALVAVYALRSWLVALMRIGYNWLYGVQCLLRGWFGIADERRRYDLGVMIIAPERELRDGVRSAGFLTRDPSLQGIRSVYIPHICINDSIRKQYEDRGLEVAAWPERLNIRESIRLFSAWLLWVPPLVCFWQLEVVAHLMRHYIRWQSFISAYELASLVSYTDFSYGHIARNILLHQCGIETWYYSESVNMGKYVTEPKYDSALSFPFWCHLYYRHMIIPNDRIVRYFEAHPNRIGNYHVVGSIWAHDLVRLRTVADRSDYWPLLRANGYCDDQQLVVLFDSWFHPDGVNSPDDIVQFAADFAEIVDSEDLFIVLKQKNPRRSMYGLFNEAECDAVYVAHDLLASMPNGCVLDHTHDASGIAALADLVISFPFTSASYECLCAGIKSVYYDPAAKFRGTYYDQFEGFVIHGRDELNARLRPLIAESDAEFFHRFYNGGIRKTEMNLRSDGLDSFRRLLRDSLAG